MSTTSLMFAPERRTQYEPIERTDLHRSAWILGGILAACLLVAGAHVGLTTWLTIEAPAALRTAGSATPMALPQVDTPTKARLTGRVIEASSDHLRVQVGTKGWVTLVSPYGRHTLAQRELGERLAAGQGVYLQVKGQLVDAEGQTRFEVLSWSEISPQPGRLDVVPTPKAEPTK